MTIAQKTICYAFLIKDYKSVVDEIQNAYATCDLLGTTMCMYILRDFNQKLANINSLISDVEKTQITSETTPKD
jgi:hypothetical protein